MSMAVGIPIGFGAGITVGLASGRQSAQEQVREYVARRQITILDSTGQEIPVRVFLDEAFRPAYASVHRKWVTLALIIMAGILALGVVTLGVALWLT